MEEDSSSNSGENVAEENSPSKKAKLDDQQPSTSSAGSSVSSDTKSSASSVPHVSDSAENATSQQMEHAIDPPNETGSQSTAAASAPTNAASSSVERNGAASRRNSRGAANEREGINIWNLERSVELLRRNVYRLTYQRGRAEDGENVAGGPSRPAENEDADSRIINESIFEAQVANELVQLLVPGGFQGYESRSDDEQLGDEEEEAEVEINNEFEIAEQIDDALSDSSSSSSDSSSVSSTTTSSSDSLLSIPRSSGSELEYPDGALRDSVDVSDLDCLKTDTVKGDWNIMREIGQRQHGVQFHKVPATVGSNQYNPSQFQKRAYGSVHLVQRMGLLHKLVYHTGCVNSLNFHPNGKLLASGSDDLRINLWNWESKKLLKSICSGHINNVFQTKFMVSEGYENDIEVISTGRDGHVRHTLIVPSGYSSTKVLFQSPLPIHKVAIPARNDRVFLMAGEDARVRLCDIRQNKIQTLVNVSRRLYSIAAHPHDPEFCVSGNDAMVRVYDLRRVKKPIKTLVPYRLPEQSISAHASVTCAVYNFDGTEILASYCDDDIYLFDNTSEGNLIQPISRFQGHCNTQTIKGVNYFGPRSEFVVSGSDCGYIYIWEKRSKSIVNWLKSSAGGVVNCLEPHPEFPIMATSGVDDDIKIWVPKGLNDEQTAPVFASHDLKRHVRRNINHRQSLRGNIMDLRAPISRFFSAHAIRRRANIVRANRAGPPAEGNRNIVIDLFDGDELDSDNVDNPLLNCSPS
ncbi:DDB1- and CUL4-associated factor 8-like [Anopheles nili]|uniref:DDB1- and CUL4-associated factor 8-like n=1 Tax=Anopheles nili TaxID=185578 RepID=UPI00237A31D0|nr:DDB1- and CUL4-associated factor 8-like [Anopheles nili]